MITLELGPSVALLQASRSQDPACNSRPLSAGWDVPNSASPAEPGAIIRGKAARRRITQLGAVLTACLGLGASALAQDSFYVSLTTAKTVGGLTLDDSTLVRVEDTGAISPILSEGHWQALLGYVPTDIDGFSRRQGFDPESAQSMAFTFLSDRGGFLDGDVLTLAPSGGLELVVSEADIVNAFGVAGTNIDLDAIDLSSGGQVFFSLQSDLPGTVLGDIKDGDVLVFDDTSLGVSLYASEDDLQVAFSFATGSTAAIGDVLGICFNSGDLWFTVQAPSSYDGAVFSFGLGGMLIRDENTMGLAGAELSALSIAQAVEPPFFYADKLSAVPGETLQFQFQGQANTLYAALFAGGTGYVDFSRRPGWGSIALDMNDPWLLSILAMPRLPYVVTDSLGVASASLDLPPSALYGLGFANEEGWSFQLLEVPGLKLSAPFRVLKN